MKESGYEEGKIGLNQCLMYMHKFPHSRPIFYFPLFNCVAKKKTILK
jgi:hypothetical protein